jgi:translocation and assembly module TamA
LAGACALSALTPEPAHALKLFGVTIFEDKSGTDTEIVDPRTYTLNLSINGDKRTENAIRSASSLVQSEDEAIGGAAGLLSLAKGDYRRIQAALYNTAHYGGTISIRINGQEAADYAVGAELPQSVDISVTVTAGPEFTFGTADLQNQAPPARTRDDRVDDPASIGFAIGQRADAGVIKRAEKLAVEAWREQGHAKATIAERRVVAAHEPNQLDATLVLDPGRKAAYGDVSVEGTERMDPEFVAWMVGLIDGEEYDPDDLERARKRLDRLGVFSTRALREADAIGEDGRLPFTLTVAERKLRRIGLGATASTSEGLGLSAYWLHRNLFGRAESLRLEGGVSGIGSTFNPNDFDYKLGAVFRKPGFIHRDMDLVASFDAARTRTDSYRETQTTAKLELQRFQTDRITLRGGAFVSWSKTEDGLSTREFLSAGLIGGIKADYRDLSIDPSSGWYADVEVKPFYEFKFANAGVRALADLRAYRALDDARKFVVAGRVKLGSVLGPTAAQTPTNDLFYAGGGGSLRGYGFRAVGVAGPGGVVTGGTSLVETSLELRARVTKDIGVVAFVDAANVGDKAFPDFRQPFLVGAGLGLRYFTGLGPIRLDIGVPLVKRPGDPTFAFYAGIGQAF